MLQILAKLYNKLRRQFSYEGTWRLCVVLTAIGLLGIAYLDLSERSWSIAPKVLSPSWKIDPICRQSKYDEEHRQLEEMLKGLSDKERQEKELEYNLQWLSEKEEEGVREQCGKPIGYRVNWSFLDSSNWQLSHRVGLNWIAIALLVGPFLVIKAIDWIVAGIWKNPDH